MDSGRVTPYKDYRIAADMKANIPVETSKNLYSTFQDGVDHLKAISKGEDSKLTGEKGIEELDKLTKTMLLFSVDPLWQGAVFRFRYGFHPGFDAGYRYDIGVHAIDLRWQFMGKFKDKNSLYREYFSSGNDKWFGSIGFQISHQSFDLPSYFGDLQDILGYEFVREDLVIPIIFSYSIGEHEKYGSLGFGLVYNLARNKYGFSSQKIQELFSQSLEEEGVNIPTGDNLIHAFGGFVNGKIGFKYAYIVASFAVYYQNYGKYRLFGTKTYSFSGLTFIPSIGIQGEF